MPMNPPARKLLFAAALFLVLPATAATPPKRTAGLAPLGSPPDWSALDPYQETITREAFEKLLFRVYTAENDQWQDLVTITDEHFTVVRKAAKPDEGRVTIRFTDTPPPSPPRFWLDPSDLGAPDDPARPLEGLHIALDPGHLGGRWAKLEKRWFQVGEAKPVLEGELVLDVARRLHKRLTALGATVTLLRQNSTPATPLRPADLTTYAHALYREQGIVKPSRRALELSRNRLFAVSAEIRARAAMVNQTVQPDLVLCLHFNAEAWGDDDKPTFATKNHLHVLVHGCLLPEEARHDDERLETLLRLLQGTHEIESELAATVAGTLAQATGLPAFEYKAGNARRVNASPYVWGRNLLANRIYQCPVVFLEPHVMNHKLTHARIQAGAYKGAKKIGGKERPNIFDEYARAVADGVEGWARKRRGG